MNLMGLDERLKLGDELFNGALLELTGLGCSHSDDE
jgi:hypothetical protein